MQFCIYILDPQSIVLSSHIHRVGKPKVPSRYMHLIGFMAKSIEYPCSILQSDYVALSHSSYTS